VQKIIAKNDFFLFKAILGIVLSLLEGCGYLAALLD